MKEVFKKWTSYTVLDSGESLCISFSKIEWVSSTESVDLLLGRDYKEKPFRITDFWKNVTLKSFSEQPRIRIIKAEIHEDTGTNLAALQNEISGNEWFNA